LSIKKQKRKIGFSYNPSLRKNTFKIRKGMEIKIRAYKKA